MAGWIKDYRQELKSDIWKMPPLYHRVWQYLKYIVNHSPETIPTRDGGKLLVKKGQRVTSYQKIAEDVKWYEWGVERIPNKKTIKAILDWLENEGMIERESNAKGTVITLCNYCIYQSKEDGESNEQRTTKKRTLDTNKNDKNDKNDKNEKKVITDSTPPTPYNKIVDLYNKTCKSLTPVQMLPESRKKNIRARWKEHPNLETFEVLFHKAENSDFLKGEKGNWAGATFDWLMRPTNFVKAMEGNYDDKSTSGDKRIDLLYQQYQAATKEDKGDEES